MDRQVRPGAGTRVAELRGTVPKGSPGKRTLVEAELLRIGPGASLATAPAAANSVHTPVTHVQLAPNASPQLDKSKEAHRLRAMIAMRQQPQIVELLEHNANQEHMYALHRAYGSTLVADVQGALTEAAYLARARVYLGEQMALDAKIVARGKGDMEAILGDLERLPDDRALALVAGESAPVAWTQPATATWLPATTTLAAVKQALHGRLVADDYYRAMRLLLSKAERALAVQAAQTPPGQNLEGFTVTIGDLAIDPSRGEVASLPLVLSPISEARVELAEARIREADASGNWMSEPMKGRAAALALTDLDRVERQALALRLRDRPLVNLLGGVSLGVDALERDDATMIRKAILDAQTLANVQSRSLRGVGLAVAIERAGELIRTARAKLEQLSPRASEIERTQAQAEVQHLESIFFGTSSPVLAMLRMNAQRASDADGGAAAIGAQLRALGADHLTIAAEQLRAVPAGDGAMLISTLRKIAAGDRAAAMQRAGLLDALSRGSMKLAHDQRELMSALVWQGSQPFLHGSSRGSEAADSTARTSDTPIVLPPVLAPSLMGPGPDVVIALHDILDAMGRHAVHEVLGRLARMSDADQRSIYTAPRYRAKFNALPEGHPMSGAGHVKESLRMAEANGARAALLAYPTTLEGEHKVHVEALGAQMDDAGPDGQAVLRRAYVLIERLGGPQKIRANPALLMSLPANDRAAVERLVGGSSGGLLRKRDHLARDDDKETANQLIFGQPQLAGKGPGALDPATEAEFMYFRLRDAAGIRHGVAIADWFHTSGPGADESVAEFMVLYRRVKGGGMSRGELAQLADRYHRALRRLNGYREATDSLAGNAALIVGATVVTIVVAVASGGTLSPVAVSAMASLSGAAASAAAGASLRIHSTMSSVLRDAGIGAVEGIAAAAGASLTARMVRAAAMGVPAARAAATVGAHAVGQASRAGTEIATAVIDGALGNAAGELFQTATDEATWDRGIAEAFAAMMAAIARGAESGAVMGGAVGGAVQVAGKLIRLVARVGRPAAQDFTRIAEAAGVDIKTLEQLSEHAQDQIARALELARAGQVVEAERLLTSVHELSGQARAIARKTTSESSAASASKGETSATSEGRIRHSPGTKGAVSDSRPRITHDRLDEMSHRLKLRVQIDDTGALHDGIKLHYVLGAHRNIRPTVLRVGPEALIDDVLVHGNIIERVTRYNGAIGKLRLLWDRLVAVAKRSGKPLQPGTKVWESYQELGKLDELIAMRQSARMAHGIVEPSILDREIEFLEGYRAHHEAVVAAAEKGGLQAKPSGHIDSPDSRRDVLDNEDPKVAGMHSVDPLGGEAAARDLAVRVSVQEKLIHDVFGASLRPEAVAELARVHGLTRSLIEQLAACGLPVTEQLGQLLAKVSSWPEKARLGLVKLAAHGSADAMRVYAKALTSLEIEGMNTWVTLASRELHNPAKILDLERSLDKGIEMRRVDSGTAMEVDYYKGKRITRAEREAERASPGFDNKEHTNIDVEGTKERWEMKRVNPAITSSRKFIDQIGEGVGKFRDARQPSLKRGGPKKNIVDVTFGNRLEIPRADHTWIKKRVQDYINANQDASKHVDEFIIHVELSGANVDIRIEVP